MERADLQPAPNRLAIVGLAFRFPGPEGDEFWRALCEGRNLVGTVDPSRWPAELFLNARKSEPGTAYTLAGGSLGCDLAAFDAAFFGISPREAAQLDPQQRLLLELAWEAFESGGIPPASVRGSRTSVYVGFSGSDYGNRRHDDFAAVDAFSMTGAVASIAANRISYFFDLRGPSMAVDTACSSSLVALHQACQSILAGESELAIAGAVNLHLHPFPYVAFSKASMLSPRGACHPFDASGDGYVRAEGGAIVLLKRLEDAMVAGDRIYAVIAGSAVNCDGKTSSLTVPSAAAQAELLQEVYSRACIDPAEIDYIEAHGTGTPVGDPIEARALGQALGSRRGSPLLVGSVKSNIGHLETASGMAGLIKAIYCLAHRMVPPSINFSVPNPNIRFSDCNLRVVRECTPLDSFKRLVVGINSFGFGGANAHVILESPPKARAVPGGGERPAPVVVSARSDQALKSAALRMSKWLREREDLPFYDLAYSAAHHREWLEHRAVAVGGDRHAVAQALEDFAGGKSAGVASGRALARANGPVFVYSGNGAQWAGMGQRLLAESAVFRDAVAEVDRRFRAHWDASLAEMLGREDIAQWLEATEYAQPLLFAVQVGITEMLRDWGVTPTAVTGHSVGEVAAAWACGALSLEQAVAVVHHRSACQGATRGAGQMTAVALPAEKARALLGSFEAGARLSIAAINSPSSITVAGASGDLAELESRLAREEIPHRRLALDYAFHSPAMNRIEAPLKRSLAGLKPSAARVPFVSTVSGGPIPGASLDAAYWWRNIREPVQFGAALGYLAATGASVFMEIGPSPVLRGYLGECLKSTSVDARVLQSMARSADGADALRERALEVLVAGCAIDRSRLFPVQGRRVELPGYPWQRERHWYAPSVESPPLADRRVVHPLLGTRVPGSDCQWERHLDCGVLPALADHRVGGEVLLPAAAFAEMALAAAADLKAAACYELDELEVRAPLILSDAHSKTVRLHLDPSDGRFTIRSRERQSTEAWNLHAVGRVTGCSEKRARAADVPTSAAGDGLPGREHYAVAAAAGLDYGPAFQVVQSAWREGDCVAASLALEGAAPEALVLARALDGCFQLLLHAVPEEERLPGVALVPVKIGRLVAHDARLRPALAKLRTTRRGPRSMLADCSLHDETGACVLTARDVRFRAVPLRRTGGANVWFLESSLEAAREGAGAALPSLERLAAVCSQRLHASTRLKARERYFSEVEPLQEAMLAAFASEALKKEPTPEGEHDRRIWSCLADLAGDQEYPQAREIWRELLDRHPDHAGEIIWLGGVGARLPELLRGGKWSGALLAPQSEFGPAIADAVDEALRCLPESGRLRVLSLDGGQAPALGLLLERLDPARCDAVLACADDGALEERRALAARYPGTAVFPLKGCRDAAAGGPFDVAIVHEGLQWAEDRAAVLRLVRGMLAPGGILICADQRLSRASALARKLLSSSTEPAPAQWDALLREHGFASSTCIAECPRHGGDSRLVLARAAEQPGAAAQVSGWLIVASESNAALDAHVVAELHARGQLTRVACPGGWTSLDWQRELALARAAMPSLAGIVYIARLGAALEEQPERCAGLASLLDAFAASSPEGAALWVVTQAAHRRADEAAFYGFARTAMNEYPGIGLRLADLADTDVPEAMAHALVDALLSPDAENEVVLGLDGRRLVRFRAVEADSVALPIAPRSVVRLTPPQGGQLRALAWRHAELPVVGDDEVEIEVKAAGLNFRDVMYAMGQLPDEALEAGFSGPSLGMEAAGVVTSVGSGVKGLRPGQQVIAFAPSSFSTRVVTKAHAVVRKPAGWSFEAACTIPAAFLTAHYALRHLARLEEGQKILIHGAAGGVGIAAVQLAQLSGAEVFATAGSDAKRDFLRLLGVQHVMDSRSLEFADEVMERTGGRGVDVVLNSLAGEAMSRSLGVLKPFGRFLELGKRDFYENTRIGLRPFRNNVAYFGIDADQLMAERPELMRRLLRELMSLFGKGQLAPLPYRAFPASEAADAFRHMQQSRHIGKVVLSFDPPPSPARTAPRDAAQLALRPDATYLVTGGLGGFGLRTAKWLASKGARHLVLMGRSGAAREEARKGLAELQAAGVRVEVARCDVSDGEALKDVLEQVRATLPPLRGVIHAAALIEDGLIRGLTAERIAEVLRPKAVGAANLDALTRDRELDFFVLYSSVSTLFGNPGQASYVAANRVLEVLAQGRRAERLPALCIGFGPIADAGYLARHPNVREALEARLGGAALTSAEALDALERALASGATALTVVRFDRGVPRVLANAAAPKYAPLLARLQPAEAAPAAADEIERWLEEHDDEALTTLIGGMVAKEIATILRMSPDRLEPGTALQELGLDSLMGVELMTAVEARFGVDIPAMAMSEVGTIERLARRIVRELRSRAGAHSAEDALTEQVRLLAGRHASEVDDASIRSLAGELKASVE